MYKLKKHHSRAERQQLTLGKGEVDMTNVMW
jgi:hypothetical protein